MSMDDIEWFGVFFLGDVVWALFGVVLILLGDALPAGSFSGPFVTADQIVRWYKLLGGVLGVGTAATLWSIVSQNNG